MSGLLNTLLCYDSLGQVTPLWPTMTGPWDPCDKNHTSKRKFSYKNSSIVTVKYILNIHPETGNVKDEDKGFYCMYNFY